jgi:hypothetical protein
MADLKFYFSDKLKKRHAPFVNFVQMMANRLIVGYYRYGSVNKRQNYGLRIKNAIKHYDKTGNTEFLIDAANYCWLEFCAPSHPDAHFEASDSNGNRVVLIQQPPSWESRYNREGD